jgi:hypothetical protein
VSGFLLQHSLDNRLAIFRNVPPSRAIKVDLAFAILLENSLVILALEARQPRDQLVGI